MHDLWEDSGSPIANEQKPKPGRVQRSPTEAAVVSALRGWLLHDYTIPYCRLLAATRIFRRCYWVDALGGSRGALAQALTQVNDTAQALASGAGDGGPPPVVLQGLLLSQARAVKRARKETEHAQGEQMPALFTLPKMGALIETDWSTVMPALQAALEQFATIFLLNLFPVTASASSRHGVPFFTQDELAPYAARTAPTELCIFISRAQVARRMLPALGTKPGASAFTALLRSDRWKAQLQQENEDERSVDAVIDLLQSALQPRFLAVPRVVFPMLIGPATVEETPFELLFATRRQDSLLCMNDALCGYRRRLEEESYCGLLNEAWFREQQSARLGLGRQALKERILAIGLAQSPRRWPDLRQQTLLAQFGAHLASEYDQIIIELVEAGALRCDWRGRGAYGTQGGQQERRVPGNDDLLLWQAKKRHY
jgi:hypothetical protein